MSSIQKILLTGVSCIGKTTIGEILANKIGYNFFDFDKEIEAYFNSKISKIQNGCFNAYDYRLKTAVVLENILNNNFSFVMALNPSGLNSCYSFLIRKTGALTICLNDSAENILNRLTFYDDDSNPIIVDMTDGLRKRYYRRIKSDITYYRRVNKKAMHQVAITNLTPYESVDKIIPLLSVTGYVNIINHDSRYAEQIT